MPKRDCKPAVIFCSKEPARASPRPEARVFFDAFDKPEARAKFHEKAPVISFLLPELIVKGSIYRLATTNLKRTFSPVPTIVGLIVDSGYERMSNTSAISVSKINNMTLL